MVYDISVNGLGVVGYLYPSSHEYEVWEYDIVLRPAEGRPGGIPNYQYDWEEFEVYIEKV